MENRFHLAIPAGDLDKAIKFYCEILGCQRGNSEFKYPDAWADINFWGNELTLHATDPDKKNVSERHNVDMGNVTVPHFGVHLDGETFQALKQRLIDKKIQFIDPPYIRFEGKVGEQATMFFKDPSGNHLEFKSFQSDEDIFAKEE